MNAVVDLAKAEAVFREAVKKASQPEFVPITPFSNLIEKVVLGPHLTYRYILTNALLAKATNNNANPLVLQAQSQLEGAFDARSLCHKVLVPLEREILGNRLGGSNEPFLNKPARYIEISETNAVRRGVDTDLRDTVIRICTEVSSYPEPFEALLDCVYWIFKRGSRNIDDFLKGNTDSFRISSVVSFATDLLSQSHEGETCAILAGTAFSLLSEIQGKDYVVKTHKVNQAGTSSNEISDVDVFLNKHLVFTAEVKDKNYSYQDVEHAIGKVAESKHSTIVFLTGPRGHLVEGSQEELVILWRNRGFDIQFINVLEFFKSLLAIHSHFDLEKFIEIINFHAENARVKDVTFAHIINCMQTQGW